MNSIRLIRTGECLGKDCPDFIEEDLSLYHNLYWCGYDKTDLKRLEPLTACPNPRRHREFLYAELLRRQLRDGSRQARLKEYGVE